MQTIHANTVTAWYPTMNLKELVTEHLEKHGPVLVDTNYTRISLHRRDEIFVYIYFDDTHIEMQPLIKKWSVMSNDWAKDVHGMYVWVQAHPAFNKIIDFHDPDSFAELDKYLHMLSEINWRTEDLPLWPND